ncbi:hypothetical protein SNEBB_002977 [Seison nebaliae]|nr:hypothetical protein SNEBB_002977 [Seison nebaliae]
MIWKNSIRKKSFGFILIIFLMVIIRHYVLNDNEENMESLLGKEEMDEPKLYYQPPIQNNNESRKNKCNIPNVKYNDRLILKYVRKERLPSCLTNEKPLTEITMNNELKVNKEMWKSYKMKSCVYVELVRNVSNFKNGIVIGPPKYLENYVEEFGRRESFHDNSLIKFENKNKIIKIFCEMDRPPKKYEYVHFIHKRNEKKINFKEDQYNVIILALDGLSNAHARRALPNSIEMMIRLNFINSTTYHSIGEGTMGNIFPLLNGLSDKEGERLHQTTIEIKGKGGRKSTVTYPGPFDDYPWLFHNYSTDGYTTFYHQDWKDSLLNHMKMGMQKPLADYYARAYWLALYNSSPYKRSCQGCRYPHRNVCYLNDYVYKNAYGWLKRLLMFNENNPIFGFHMFNEFSHDFMNRLYSFDEYFAKTIENISRLTSFQRTFLLIISDHGNRQSAIRQTEQGRLEEHLPFISVHIPPLFHRRYPEETHRFRENMKGLITLWDMHEMLINIHHISKYDYETSRMLYKKRKESNKVRGYSPFFQLIPQRSCSEAFIPKHLCVCKSATPLLTNDQQSKDRANFLLEQIRKKIEPISNLCEEFKLDEIIHISALPQISHQREIIITIKVKPMALFEAHLLENVPDDKIVSLIHMARIDTYGRTADCVLTDRSIKPFCFCKNRQ